MTREFSIRLMVDEDFDAVVRLDERVRQQPRPDYYKLRFERLFETGEYLPTSLVAENGDALVIGFIMGELYIGEYGISQEGATIDTIGVDPEYRHLGVGRMLMDEFVDHLKQLGVKKVNTLVDKTDDQLIRYFNANRFNPSKTVVNLERDI